MTIDEIIGHARVHVIDRKTLESLENKKAEIVSQQPCEDYVSRDDAIELIAGTDETNGNEPVFSGKQVIKMLKSLPSVTPKAKWIPVSEKLPEEKSAVLVWCSERKNIYCAYLEEKQWWIFGAFSEEVIEDVIAWMPLPEPYKAESENKE